jgi:transcriptional regulator with XRE-family HTH domain
VLNLLNFYDRYINLCASVHKSPSKVAEEIGLSRPAVSSWKTGKAKPSDVTVLKIAEYFNVSINYLLGESEEPEEIKKDPIPKNGNEVSDLDTFTLNILHKLTPECQEKAIARLLELAAESANNE